MDKLKDFIDTNREAFDQEFLPEGHFERFEKKLPAKSRNRAKIYSLMAFVAAACIALFFLFRLPGGTPIPQSQKTLSQQPHKCAMKEEIEELRLYYNMQMNDVISQMKEIYKQQQLSGAEELLQETKRVLTDNYMFEETVLPTLPCSNDGLFAMNQHYKSSLKSLNIMLKQMEKMDKSEINNKK